MDSPAIRPLAEVIAGRRRLIEEKRRLREQCNIACANRHATVLRVRAALVQSSSLAKTYNALMAMMRLGQRIRQKLNDGRLPSTRDTKVFGAPGNGGRCAACDDVLPTRQVMIEIPSVDGGGHEYYLHAPCFMLWDEIRLASGKPLIRRVPRPPTAAPRS
jgi:hypothetical protein